MRSLLVCLCLAVLACGSADDGGGAVDANGAPCPGGCSDSELCLEGTCVPASCRDTNLGGDETDIDCGGSCLACAEGQHCLVPDDCASKFCDSDNVCRDCQTVEDCAGAPDTYCDSGRCLPIKALGASCSTEAACDSTFCVDDVCCESACADGTCSAEGMCLVELCDDGIDNDGDTLIDEGCSSNPYYY